MDLGRLKRMAAMTRSIVTRALAGYAPVRRDGKLVEYSLSEDQGANCHRRSLGYDTPVHTLSSNS
jgi:hypothetical protein